MDGKIEKIKVNIQSSIYIRTKYNIYFDPYKIKEELNNADVIFITHRHPDHFSVSDIKKVCNKKTIFIAPRSMASIINGTCIDINKVRLCNPHMAFNVLDMTVYTTPAYNLNNNYHPQKENWVGYIIETNENRIYVAGVTDALVENEKIKCDIAFIPIGGKYTMDEEDAANFVNKIHPRIVIPIHFKNQIPKSKSLEKFCGFLKDKIEVKNILGEQI